MAVLEIHTFAPQQGMNAADFRALDERMQEWCYLNRPGIARRTTAKDDNGSYVVVTLFDSADQATQTYLASSDALVKEWTSCMQAGTSTAAVYSLL
jgi:hypothetical protein